MKFPDIIARSMDLARDGNLIEAGVWFVLAIVLIVRACLAERPVRSILMLLAVTLAAFGFSDVVESRTGAWWRPWWLFVWKTIWVGLLLLGFTRYFKLVKKSKAGQALPDSDP